MAVYRELVYSCLDLLKVSSDDSFFSEEHIMFLLGKFRGLLLEQKYKEKKEEMSDSNYQTLCLDLVQVPAITGEPCEGGVYLRSKEKIPALVPYIAPKVYAEDYFQGEITYVSRERMRYVGYNKWLSNIIYVALGPDNYLYFKSFNPQYLYLEKARITGVFEDPEKAAELECEKDETLCDIMDRKFPLEESLIPQLIELVVKELSKPEYLPEDKNNNADDDLTKITGKNGRDTK